MNINLTSRTRRDRQKRAKVRAVSDSGGSNFPGPERLRERDRSPVALEKDDQRLSAVRDMLDFVEKNRTRLQDITVKHCDS